MDAKTKPGSVEGAVAGIGRANLKLINLLRSEDESVRAGASTPCGGSTRRLSGT